jgi:peptidoglycan-N-acetylglucosamine deacetylase
MTSLQAIAAILLAITIAVAVMYYACSVPTSQLLGRALVRGPAEGHRIALTFDDGPAPPFTDQILEILRESRVHATFFVCGENVERHPETLRRIRSENHCIGNHTYSHPLLYLKSRSQIAAEIDRTQAIVRRVTGERPNLFRAPYGVRWLGLFPLLRERGIKAVQWSDTGFDWKEENSSAEIARLVLKRLKPGAVILLHDGHNNLPPEQLDRSRTVAALPAIIEGARRAGFAFVPVEEFLPRPS